MARRLFAVAACAFPLVGCAAILGIDDVTVANDGGPDAASGDGSQGDARDGALVGDAPSEAEPFDAAGCDASAPRAEAGLVQCGTVSCGSQSSEPICCPSASPSKECYPSDAGGCIGPFFQCDKKSDCTMTEICCMHTATPVVAGCPFTTDAVASSRCESVSECPAGETELCTADEPCLGDGGKSCRLVTASFADDTTTYTRSVGGCF